jgi:leader peptidase (prepilin peptidase) / N-methyltransferase
MHGVLFSLSFVAGLTGLVVGSFLNVVIVRIPEGRSVVRPPSACPRCAYQLKPWDNIPILSWLLLGRKCRSCRLPIPVRYPIVEGLTGLLFAGTALRIGWSAELPAVLLFIAGGVALSAIDIDTMRLPRKLIFIVLALVGAALLVAAAFTRNWSALMWAAIGSVAAGSAFFALRVAVPKGFGMGDVRLAFLLGAITGWYGPGRVALGLFLGFLFGSVVGIIVALVSGQLRKKKIPFGPMLNSGALFAVLFGAPILHWYSTMFSV